MTYKLGSDDIANRYIGDQVVLKVYLGDTEVFNKED